MTGSIADSDQDLAGLVCSLPVCSVIAAAGCGKTEQITKVANHGDGRRLLLTHTHAGVDALRRRLRENQVPSSRYFIDTIAGWCLRYAASFPGTSGLQNAKPRSDKDWSAVYLAAEKLIVSGSVNRVLQASYCGVLVDEYQDCSSSQHGVVKALSKVLPVGVFGDPLQAIFDFKGQTPLDWPSEVLPHFPQARRLTEPHRWLNEGNAPLANWLGHVRCCIEDGKPIDLGSAPSCVSWAWLPDQEGPRQNAILTTCRSTLQLAGDVVVIADPQSENGRAAIAKGLAKLGFSTIEPIECKSLYASAKVIAATRGPERLEATLKFLSKCMTGTRASDFRKAVASRLTGGTRGTAVFGGLVKDGVDLHNGADLAACLALIEGFAGFPKTYAFRREMLFAMRSALRSMAQGECPDLVEAVRQVQTEMRHAGRKISYRSVGSTLLVKGLQFSNAVIVHSANMNRNDWYVALTRATQTLTILSPNRRLVPA